MVWVRIKDIERIAAFLGMETEPFMQAYVDRIGKRFSLKEYPNGDCVFWHGKCTIYEVRPPQCRSFPFWEENLHNRRAWRKAAARCPGMNRGETFPPYRMVPEAALAELKEIYRFLDEESATGEVDCDACGTCCNFAAYGHDVFATFLEVAYLLNTCGAPQRTPSRERCGYLDESGRCTAREGRVLGCRVFFCRKDGDTMQEVYERYHRMINSVVEIYSLAAVYDRLDVLLEEMTG